MTNFINPTLAVCWLALCLFGCQTAFAATDYKLIHKNLLKTIFGNPTQTSIDPKFYRIRYRLNKANDGKFKLSLILGGKPIITADGLDASFERDISTSISTKHDDETTEYSFKVYQLKNPVEHIKLDISISSDYVTDKLTIKLIPTGDPYYQ